jgi:hypothetical protein
VLKGDSTAAVDVDSAEAVESFFGDSEKGRPMERWSGAEEGATAAVGGGDAEDGRESLALSTAARALQKCCVKRTAENGTELRDGRFENSAAKRMTSAQHKERGRGARPSSSQ